MESRMENTWTRCENPIGTVAAVASTASRSFRSDRRSVDSSAAGGGVPLCLCAGFDFKVDWVAGGLEVASLDELVGREAWAASRSLEWSSQNRMYLPAILSKYSAWTLWSSNLQLLVPMEKVRWRRRTSYRPLKRTHRAAGNQLPGVSDSCFRACTDV